MPFGFDIVVNAACAYFCLTCFAIKTAVTELKLLKLLAIDIYGIYEGF